MLAIAKRIREHDERLADALAELISSFAYDQVLALVEQAGEPM
jgi:hypothetical protein